MSRYLYKQLFSINYFPYGTVLNVTTYNARIELKYGSGRISLFIIYIIFVNVQMFKEGTLFGVLLVVVMIRFLIFLVDVFYVAMNWSLSWNS